MISSSGNLNRLIARSASGTFVLRVFYLVSGFLVTLLLTHWIGPESLGIYNFSLSWIVVLAVFSKLGLEEYVARETATLRGDANLDGAKKVWRASTRIAVGMATISMIVFTLIIMSSKTIGSSVKTCLVMSSVLIPVLVSHGMYRAWLRGTRRAVESQIPEFLIRPVLMIAGVMLCWAIGVTASPDYAVGLNVLATLTALGAGITFVHRTSRADLALPNISSEQPGCQDASIVDRLPREHLLAAVPFVMIASLQIVNQRTDRIMLGIYVDMPSVAIYTVAVQFSAIVSISLIGINAIVGPLIAECRKTGVTMQLQHAILHGSAIASAASLLIVLGLGMTAPRVLVVFGEAYEGGYRPMMILAIAQLFNVAAGPAGTILSMAGHEKLTGLGVAVSAMVNVTMNYVLIPKYGLMGAAVATGISIVTWNLMLVIIARRKTGVAANVIALLIPSDIKPVAEA